MSINLDAEEGTLAAARDDLERRIRAGTLHSADELRDLYSTVWSQPNQALELVYTEYVLRIANGEAPNREDWYRRYPEWRDRLERLFGLNDLLTGRDTHRNQLDATLPDLAPDAVEQPDHPPGYEVFEELGRGGMAVVYRARQLELNRVVALKVLRGGAWFRDEDAVRIRREAEAAARLQHPNIVQIHEIGDWDGVPFLALEYVAGGTLGEFLTQSQRHGTLGATPRQAAELVETLARAMHYAHSQGVVHRDLKPANVLMAGDRRQETGDRRQEADGQELSPASCLLSPKIADFGLAVTFDLSLSISQTATLVGTPCYMAPEQADSRRDAIGPRTDVYALGGILYEMLTGRPPFQGATVLETLELVRHAEPVAPRQLRPQVPRDLETICLKCLAKGPERRYESAAALAEDLERFHTGQPILARPVSTLERGWKWCRRRPQTATLLAALAGTLGVAVALPTHYWQRAEIARESEAEQRQQAEQRTAALLIAAARLQWRDHDLPSARESLAACDPIYRDGEWRYLNRACRAPVRELDIGPRSEFPALNSFTALAFSPAGKTLAGQQRTNQLKVWDTATGQLSPLAGVGTILNAEFVHPSPTETVAAVKSIGLSGKGVNQVYRVDLTTGKPTILWRHTGALAKLTVSENGQIAAYQSTGTIVILDLTTGQERCQITPGQPNMSLVFELTADGQLLATHAGQQDVRVWNTTTGMELHRILPPAQTAPTSFTYIAAIRGDGMMAAYRTSRAGRSNDLILRAVDTSAPEVTIPTGVFELNRVRFSPNGRLIAMAGREGTHVGVWETQTGREVVLLRGHRDRVQVFAFSPDSQHLAIACAGGRVAIWDIRPE